VKAQDPHTEAAASGRHIRDLGLRQLAPLHLGWCLCGVRVRAPPVQRHNPPPNPVNLQSMKPCCEVSFFGRAASLKIGALSQLLHGRC